MSCVSEVSNASSSDVPNVDDAAGEEEDDDDDDDEEEDGEEAEEKGKDSDNGEAGCTP